MPKVRCVPALICCAVPAASALAAPPFLRIDARPGPDAPWDILPDGRMLAVNVTEVLLETSPGSGVFDLAGTLPEGTVAPWGASFVRINPSGSTVAVGDNNFGGAWVSTFDVADLLGSEVPVTRFLQENFDAAWVTDSHLAVTYANLSTFFGEVAWLDTVTGEATVILSIDGASGGIAFDDNGNLFTANGFDLATGGSDTGEIRVFAADRILDVLDGVQPAINFASEGLLVADLLTASPLDFDDLGNLFVGGGDLFGGSGDYGYFAILHRDGIADTMAGHGPVDPRDIFRRNPQGGDTSLYTARFSPLDGAFLVQGDAASTVLLFEETGRSGRLPSIGAQP